MHCKPPVMYICYIIAHGDNHYLSDLCVVQTYQATVDYLSWGLLHLSQLGDEVPEAGLGYDMVRGEDPHPVQRRGRVLDRGQQTPNDFVLPKLCAEKQSVLAYKCSK